MKRRWILLNPGPVNVTGGVRRALLAQDLCHREPEFARLLASIRLKLVTLFGAARTHTAAVLTGSGTLAVEAMLVSASRSGRKILVLSNGVYGDRLVSILKAHRVPHTVLSAPPGAFPSETEIRQALRRDPSIGALAMVHHETSNGMLNPLASVARLCRTRKIALLVDAVSSLGAETLNVREVDFLAGSSGKCLHGYPGVAFVLISKKRVPELTAGRAAAFYADLGAVLASEENGAPPFTPAVPLYAAFDRALSELQREGLSRRIASYARKQAFLQKKIEALGLKILAPRGQRSHALTAAWLPAGLSYASLHTALKKKNFIIYAGQSAFKDRIFRVSNLGAVSLRDLRRFLKLLETEVRRAAERAPSALVLAAGIGRRFGRRTRALPKCLIPLRPGLTLLGRYLEAFRETGIRRVTFVVGHEEARLRRAARRHGQGLRIRFVRNRDYRRGSVVSLACAARVLSSGPTLVMDADVFFPTEALQRLLAGPEDLSAVLLDPRSKASGEEMMVVARRGSPARFTKRPAESDTVLGEATGLVRFESGAARRLASILKRRIRAGAVDDEYEAAYEELLRTVPMRTVSMEGLFWKEMDFESDLRAIRSALVRIPS